MRASRPHRMGVSPVRDRRRARRPAGAGETPALQVVAMSFVLQRVTPRGLVLNQVSGDVLRIGRGTNAELRSDNPAVSLDHAAIIADAAGYAITDKGSITGTYVNGKPVETARLAKGDVIEAGDLRIEVQIADPGRPLFLRVVQMTRKRFVDEEEEEEEALPVAPVVARAGGVVKAPKIDYAGAFRLNRQNIMNSMSIYPDIKLVGFYTAHSRYRRSQVALQRVTCDRRK